jgi:hypothetical protein
MAFGSPETPGRSNDNLLLKPIFFLALIASDVTYKLLDDCLPLEKNENMSLGSEETPGWCRRVKDDIRYVALSLVY